MSELKKILDWILSHKFLTAIVTVLVFALPLVVVHCLFKWYSGIPWLAAEWLAGDILGYIAGFEALLGTVILGAVTIYQTQKAEEANKRLAKENNYLQKISIQQMLPLVKIVDIAVGKTIPTSYRQFGEPSTVTVASVGKQSKRETHLRICMPLQGSENSYHKQINFTIENISHSPISRIAVEKVEFSGFKYKGDVVEISSCIGVKDAKYINWLILPGDVLPIVVDIYFDNSLFKDFWEFDSFDSIGCFDMCLYIINTSMSGIEYGEKIYIEKCVGFKEYVVYKTYEGEIENA